MPHPFCKAQIHFEKVAHKPSQVLAKFMSTLNFSSTIQKVQLLNDHQKFLALSNIHMLNNQQFNPIDLSPKYWQTTSKIMKHLTELPPLGNITLKTHIATLISLIPVFNIQNQLYSFLNSKLEKTKQKTKTENLLLPMLITIKSANQTLNK